MPRGRNVTLATGTGSLFGTLTGGDRATLLILNPNDGIVYLTINSQASPAVWDFIVPSQSRAYLPGPWLTYGVYYLDQSGAGHSGNITIFESDIQMLLPDYGSIGRALQAQVTTVDIVEGAQPGNPAVGIGRLWVDNNGKLNVLLSDGTTHPVINPGDAAGGVLTGTYPNPGIIAGLRTTSFQANGNAIAGPNEPEAIIYWDNTSGHARFGGFNPGAGTWQPVEIIGTQITLNATTGIVIPNLQYATGVGSRINGYTGAGIIVVSISIGAGKWLVSSVGMAQDVGAAADNYVWYLTNQAGLSGGIITSIYQNLPNNGLWGSVALPPFVFDNSSGTSTQLNIYFSNSQAANIAGDFSRITAVRIG